MVHLRARSHTTKRTRKAGFPPSGDSCHACRAAKVKCDSGRPKCGRCSRKNLLCDHRYWQVSVVQDANTPIPSIEHCFDNTDDQTSGYFDFDNLRDSLHRIYALEHPTTTPVFNPQLQVLSSWTFTPSEKAMHNLEYFLHKTIDRVTYRGPKHTADVLPTFWNRNIASSRREPALFYALAALGGMHRSSTMAFHTTLMRDIDLPTRSATFRFYGLALHHLQRCARDAQGSEGALEIVLCCCVVLLVVGLFQDNVSQAALHYRWGNRIKSQYVDGLDVERSPAVMLASRVLSRGHNDRTMTRCLFAEGVDLPTASSAMRHTGSVSGDLSGASFTHVREAEIALDEIITQAHGIQMDMLEAAEDALAKSKAHADLTGIIRSCVRHSLSRILPTPIGLRDRFERALTAYHSWSKAVRRLIAEQSSCTLAERALLTLLRIRSLTLHFTLSNYFSLEETSTNAYLDDFKLTCSLIETYLSLGDPHREHHLPTSERPLDRAGVFDSGILPALVTIINKCRCPSTRKCALDLLRASHRQEGPYQSDSLARFGQFVVWLEQWQAAELLGSPIGQSRTTLTRQEDIPERARFLDVMFYVDTSSSSSDGDAVLVCTRVAHESNRELRIERYRCVGGGDVLEKAPVTFAQACASATGGSVKCDLEMGIDYDGWRVCNLSSPGGSSDG